MPISEDSDYHYHSCKRIFFLNPLAPSNQCGLCYSLRILKLSIRPLFTTIFAKSLTSGCVVLYECMYLRIVCTYAIGSCLDGDSFLHQKRTEQQIRQQSCQDPISICSQSNNLPPTAACCSSSNSPMGGWCMIRSSQSLLCVEQHMWTFIYGSK